MVQENKYFGDDTCEHVRGNIRVESWRRVKPRIRKRVEDIIWNHVKNIAYFQSREMIREEIKDGTK